MPNLLCERRRIRGRHDEEWNRGKEHPVEMPTYESMKARHVDRKLLNENLSPLWRFLHRSVGRLWNDVYAEICAAVPKDSAVQRHVFQHLEQAVHKNVRLEADGNVYTPHRNNPLFGRHTWYVHPEDGTLQAVRINRVRSRHSLGERPAQIGDHEVALSRNGVWFAVTLERSTRAWDSDVWVQRPDHICVEEWMGFGYGKNSRSAHQFAAYGRSDVHAVAKRQLGKREIRKLWLR